MVLLEIATLIMAGVGLADYYHTTVYRENLRQLKEKYGEHPNIDEAFEDICTLGGEYFTMPELVLDKENPHIDMGHFYLPNSDGPYRVLKTFFTTPEDRRNFGEKYFEEVIRQRDIRNKKLEQMYNIVIPLYNQGKLDSMGKDKMHNRVFTSSVMIAKSTEHYKNILKDICKNTIWGDIVESGPGDIHGSNNHYISTWLIKDDVFQRIQNKEIYTLLFECCYFHLKYNDW